MGKFMYEDFIPERLARLRIQKGVSARDMSLSLGQSNNYVNSIENRKALPSMQAFFYICEYLGITPAEFFDSENECPADLRRLTDEARRLDAESLSLVLELVRKLAGRR